MSNLKVCAEQVIPRGLSAREHAKFRQPRGKDTVIATLNEDDATYPASVNATASGETSVISAPGEGKAIRIKSLMVNNVGADQLVVSFREGTSGADKFTNSMPQYGSMWNMNFIGAYWIIKENTALLVNLSAIGDVNIQPGYDIVESAATKALTDTVSIVEDLETTHVEGA